MEQIRHDLRLSEVISPFGVGAIVDVLGESLVAPDTSWWDSRRSPEISCERLLARIGAGVLREPPTHAGRAKKDIAVLQYLRFPAWRFCERCTKLSKLTGRKKGKWINRCECGGLLVPMRYIAICEKGSHAQDIPWFKWTHRGPEAARGDSVRFCQAYRELRFERRPDRGEGLGSLQVKCYGCGHARSLAELVTKNALHRDNIRCDGRQPWERADATRASCEHQLFAVQRGATGNYLAERISALDIPEERPQSVEIVDTIRRHIDFGRIVADNGGPRAFQLAEWIAEDLHVTAETVLAVATGEESSTDEVTLDLKDGEWAAFLKKLESGRDGSVDDFVVDGWRPDPASGPEELVKLIAGVGQVRRVREVRVLKGFRRHSMESDLIKADLGPDRWRRPTYPAIELFGEGIFLRFDEQTLVEWEQQPAVQARAGILQRRRSDLPWAERLADPEPRFIALHTMSHLLIRRLAFASGYSSASLQERIYANTDRTEKTAGILIYTAAGDAQGTLGGLVRLGKPKKLIPMIISSLDDADVCSNDPVCIESDRQGSAHLNLSACHGCALVSETSCETGNRLLDRQLILGGGNVQGLLDRVLDDVR